MTIQLAPQTIEALAFVISGGPGNEQTTPIGIYRSGPKLESFMRTCGVMMSIGTQSRYPTLVNALMNTVRQGDPEVIKTIIERAADPRDFVQVPEKLADVVAYLNRHLVHDGLELQHQGGVVRLVQAGTSASVVETLATTLQEIDFDTVRRDLDRALAGAESDPEDAVTAACSMIESVCRSVLIELNLPLPARMDVQGLYRAIREPLGLSPGREDFPPEIANDIRGILGALIAMIQGIGALRTHAGDAHGRERGFRRIDPRIARLAIHCAGSACLFIIETWQHEFPTKPMRASPSRSSTRPWRRGV